MANDNALEIQIVLDDGQVRTGFARIKADGKSTSDFIGGAFSSSFAGMAQSIAAVTAGFLAFRSIKNFFGDAINQAAEAEANLNRLNNAMKMAGTFSESASKQFQDLANEIQNTTTIEDDAVISLAALARNLTSSNEQAMKLTQAAIELSAATGVDTNTALMQLNGTLSGTAGRLNKVVPELQNFTAEQLKSGAAIDVVREKFRGAASAEVQTYSGSLKRLSNIWGDLLENIGKYVTSSKSISTVINTFSDIIKALSDSLSASLGNKDIFKDLIINFSVIMQAGMESARRIGLSFELAFLRAQQAWYAFKVLTTAGFSDAINAQLAGVLERIEQTKAAFSQDSAATQFFDTLIGKLVATNTQLNAVSGRDGSGGGVAGVGTEVVSALSSLQTVSGPIDGVSKTFSDFGASFMDTAQTIAWDSNKLVKEAGTQAFNSLANGVASGMGAIGKALVTGEDMFQAFAGAMLGALGQAAMQMGSTYILMGIARAFSSYGLDGTAAGLIATGSALSVLGGAMAALGNGASKGPSKPTVSAGADPVGYVGGLPSNENPSTNMDSSKEQSSRVTVNIQGDVLDSRESGLRIIEMINDAGFASGGKVFA